MSRREKLHLTHVLVASDLNARYLDFWPLVRRAWRDVVGLEPVLVLIADDDSAPGDLGRDPGVHLFPPLPKLHSAFQAQCIRLLYPALLTTHGGVLISDADMAPLSKRYFHRTARLASANGFVAYRSVFFSEGEIPMCYNAALPSTWGEIFDVRSMDDVRRHLSEWAHEVEYSGHHGGVGWVTDQQILYRTLTDFHRRTGRVSILGDDQTGFRRLERRDLSARGRLGGRDRFRIRSGYYSDFHCVHPYSENRALNDRVVDVAAEVAGWRRRSWP